MILKTDDGLLSINIGTVSKDDVKNNVMPTLPTCNIAFPVAQKMCENYGAYYVEMSDGSIHVVSIGAFVKFGLVDLKLPEIAI
jgi:hypothetical protein